MSPIENISPYNGTILLAEDNLELLQVMYDTLMEQKAVKKENVKLVAVRSQGQALDFIRQHRPDVLVTGLGLPPDRRNSYKIIETADKYGIRMIIVSRLIKEDDLDLIKIKYPSIKKLFVYGQHATNGHSFNNEDFSQAALDALKSPLVSIRAS